MIAVTIHQKLIDLIIVTPFFKTVAEPVTGDIWIELLKIHSQTFWIDMASIVAAYENIFMTLNHLHVNYVADFRWKYV